MKTPSSELHHLIHSLSADEKRHFKRTAKPSQEGQSAVYRELFDAISQQAEYDEKSLKQEFAPRLNDNRFSVAKNYLYQSLLKLLASRAQDESIQQKVRQELNFLEVLYNREMYRPARKHLNKAEKLWKGIDDPLLALQITEWRFRLSRVEYYQGTSPEQFSELLLEVDGMLAKIKEHFLIFKDSAEFMYHLSKDGFVRPSEEFLDHSHKILERPHFKAPIDHAALPTQVLYHNTWGIYHYTQGQYSEAFGYYQALFRLVEEAPALIHENPQFYTGMLFNFGAIALQDRQFQTVHDVIALLEAFKKGGSRLMARIFYFTTILKTRTVLDSLTLEHSDLLLYQVSAEVSRHERHLLALETIVIYFNLALLAFFRNDFTRSLQLIGYILNHSELYLYGDIQLIAGLIRLVIHFELGNYDLLETLGGSLYRSLAKKKDKFAFENRLARLFRKFPNLAVQSERKRYLIGLKAEMSELMLNPEGRRFAQYFDFDSWIESQLQGKSLEAVVREGLAPKP